MGNKRSRRSRRLETPSPSREENVESPNPGNTTLTNSNLVDQENLGPNILENQLTEPSLISNEIQVWTQEMEKRNNDRIGKMREEIDSKFEAILKEIKTNKNASTITNPRSETNETQNSQPSGSRDKSIGVHASLNENSDSENEDHPLRASKMKDLRHPAKPMFRAESDVDVTIHSDEESDAELVEDYHKNRTILASDGQIAPLPLSSVVKAEPNIGHDSIQDPFTPKINNADNLSPVLTEEHTAVTNDRPKRL